jgi:hypothetical protein
VVALLVTDPSSARGAALFAPVRERGQAANPNWDTGALLAAL